MDVDNERDFEAIAARYDEWRAEQSRLVEARYGQAPLPEPLPRLDLRVWDAGAAIAAPEQRESVPGQPPLREKPRSEPGP